MSEMKDTLQSIVESVWSTMVGSELVPRSAERDTSAAISESLDGAFVEITGAWEGRITVRLSPGALDAAITSLLGIDPSDATPEERNDVLKELANMVGGNLKAMMNQPTRLSVPSLDNDSPPPTFDAATEESICLEQNGLPVEVGVFHRGV